MKSDVKIGIALGIIVAVGAIIWFTMRGDKTESPSPVIVVPEEHVAKPTPTPAPAPVIPPVTPLSPATMPAPVAAPAATPAPVIPPAPITLPTTVTAPAPSAVPSPVVPPVAEKPVPQDKEQPKERFHVVATGETLTQIAEMYYGQSKHWKVIYEANRTVIKDPDILIAGKKLRIPYPEEIATAKKP